MTHTHLVESPTGHSWNVVLASCTRDERESLLSSVQLGGEGHVEMKAALFQSMTSSSCLCSTHIGESNVGPPREALGSVPLRLSMPYEGDRRMVQRRRTHKREHEDAHRANLAVLDALAAVQAI